MFSCSSSARRDASDVRLPDGTLPDVKPVDVRPSDVTAVDAKLSDVRAAVDAKLSDARALGARDMEVLEPGGVRLDEFEAIDAAGGGIVCVMLAAAAV